jgi:hypothetical protein
VWDNSWSSTGRRTRAHAIIFNLMIAGVKSRLKTVGNWGSGPPEGYGYVNVIRGEPPARDDSMIVRHPANRQVASVVRPCWHKKHDGSSLQKLVSCWLDLLPYLPG